MGWPNNPHLTKRDHGSCVVKLDRLNKKDRHEPEKKEKEFRGHGSWFLVSKKI